MTLDELYQIYQAEGLAGIRTMQPQDAAACFYAAVLTYAAGEPNTAVAFAEAATALAPTERLYAEAALFLRNVAHQGKQQVYVMPDAFVAFIRGGGNIGLYAATSAALRTIYAGYASLSLLDAGVGDGLALLPALTPNVTALTLVEPSAALLARTRDALKNHPAIETFEGTLQEFLANAAGERQWDVVQMTFSLHTVPYHERANVLQGLRRIAKRLLVVEFDVPALCSNTLAPTCVTHVAARYREGLAEYPEPNGLVAQGFLMPVMFGYVDPSAARVTYEQPIAAWANDLSAGGFSRVRIERLFPYWWADACLIEAEA